MTRNGETLVCETCGQPLPPAPEETALREARIAPVRALARARLAARVEALNTACGPLRAVRDDDDGAS
jgi:hypothetical protein